MKIITIMTKHIYAYTTLDEGLTNVYPINIEKTTDDIIGFTDKSGTELSGSILIVDSVGKNIFENELFLDDDGWKTTLPLSEGTYYIKILSKEVLGFDYQLYIRPNVLIKKRNRRTKIKKL